MIDDPASPAPPVLALFGATGRTGRHVLDQALVAGWHVQALVRRPETLAAHPLLTVVRGDLADEDARSRADAVDRVVAGATAVVTVIGHVKGSPDDLQTSATTAIVGAMRDHGVRRIVSLSGGGVRYPERDRPKVADRLIRGLLTVLQPTVLRDAEQHVEVLRGSGLDWTVVRGPVLTDGPRTGSYRVGWVGVDASTKISRADLAEHLLAEVGDDRRVGQLPFVSY